MELSDLIRDIFAKGEIRDNDLEAALGASGIKGIEIPDSVKEKFNQTYLTRVRAKNDPDIVQEISNSRSREIWNKVDEHIHGMLDLVDDESKVKIKDQTKKTYEKLEALKEGLTNGFAAIKAKKGSEDVRKVEEEWSGKLKTAQDERKTEIETLKTGFKNTMLNNALRLKVSEFTFGEQFKTLKDTLSNSIIEKLKGEQYNGKPIVLELDENGAIQVRHSVDGIVKDVYDNQNVRVTVDTLLKPHVEPFIVKSGGAGNNGGGNNGQNGEKRKIELPKNPTLYELRAAGL